MLTGRERGVWEGGGGGGDIITHTWRMGGSCCGGRRVWEEVGGGRAGLVAPGGLCRREVGVWMAAADTHGHCLSNKLVSCCGRW
jgi:hypothetical protein